MIKRWHIPICGFTQSLDRVSGIERLWSKLRSHVSHDVSLIPPQRWKSDWKSIAEFIWRLRPESGVPDVRIYAYSWGCGHGFVSLSKELRKRGIPVRFAVLCDPVYHSWVRPWRAMLFSPAIKIPDNVREVYWFRQNQNKPMATDLKATGDTIIHDPVWLPRDHQYMDDAAEFHNRCVLLDLEK
mgnify:FL=1